MKNWGIANINGLNSSVNSLNNSVLNSGGEFRDYSIYDGINIMGRKYVENVNINSIKMNTNNNNNNTNNNNKNKITK